MKLTIMLITFAVQSTFSVAILAWVLFRMCIVGARLELILKECNVAQFKEDYHLLDSCIGKLAREQEQMMLFLHQTGDNAITYFLWGAIVAAAMNMGMVAAQEGKKGKKKVKETDIAGETIYSQLIDL